MRRIHSVGLLTLIWVRPWFESDRLLAQDAKLQFEVASVRPAAPRAPQKAGGAVSGGLVSGGPGTKDPERIRYDHVPFQRLLMEAYGVQADQIKGPAWAASSGLDAPRFDISAKIPPGATKVQVATMLQNLLVERFELSLHRETGAYSGYALVAAKGGPQLKASAGPPRDSERAVVAAGQPVHLATAQDGFPQLFPERNMGGQFRDGVVRMRFRDYPVSDLIQQLTFLLGVRVADKTALAGTYDFTLEFAPPDDAMMIGIGVTMPLAHGQIANLNQDAPQPFQEEAAPVVAAALEKQLGLKLERARIAVELLVIDRVLRTPAGN